MEGDAIVGARDDERGAARGEIRGGVSAQAVDETDRVEALTLGLVNQTLQAGADVERLVFVARDDGHVHDVGGTRGRAVRGAGEGFAGEDEEFHFSYQ